MDHGEKFQNADEITKFSRLSRQDRVSSENLDPNVSSHIDHCEYQKIDTRRKKTYPKNRESTFHKSDLCEFNVLETKESTETSVQILKKSYSMSPIQDVTNDISLGTANEVEQLFGSPSSSESSDNTLKYIEHMLKYKPKNKGIDKLQKLNEKLYQESVGNAVLISETEFKSNEIHSNKQYYNSSLHTHSEESKSKISNINIVITSESEDVSLYCDTVHTDNYFTTTETQVKELSATPGTFKSYEIFNQNITKYNSDYCKSSMECEQIITDIKTGLSVASDTVSPMNYKLKSKSVHEEQIHDKKIGLDTLERTDTVGGPSIKLNTDCEAVSPVNHKSNEMLNQNNNFVKPLVNSQPSTPNIKTSPYIVKKSPAMSVKKTPNKSTKYHYIESPVAAYIYNSPRVPLLKGVSTKKTLPSSSRKLKKPTSVKPMKSNNKYHYIQSPVAAYINNSHQVPMVKNVDPKKPLPTTSNIVHQVTVSEVIESSDKENINLMYNLDKSDSNT